MTPTTATAIDTTTDTSAQSSTGLPVDYGWEKAVIAHWCGVQLLDVHAWLASRTIGQHVVAVVEIVLTVGATREAQTLAVLLDLPAIPSDPAVAWQTWTGWVSALSAQRPVLVTVTAPTTHREA
jgi:hypothetical protein